MSNGLPIGVPEATGGVYGEQQLRYDSQHPWMHGYWQEIPAYGGFADVSWVLGMETGADMDRFADWQATDTGYQDRVASAADLFVEGSGETSLVEKIN